MREDEAVDVGVEVVRQLRHDEALVEADLIDRRGPAPPGPAAEILVAEFGDERCADVVAVFGGPEDAKAAVA